ncbi:MAG: hypothetical protein ABI887_05065 [Burkholderiales bacterium]
MRTLTTALLTLTLLAATGAIAADKPKKESAFGKGGGAFLTRDQLRVCLNLKGRSAQQDDALAKEQVALVALKDEISRGGDTLKARLETLDRTDAEAVTGYNDASQVRDKQIDDYQARVTAFNTQVETNKADHDAYAKGCENRRFFEDDEIALKKSK